MSTILWNGTVLAADTQNTHAGTGRISSCHKIFKVMRQGLPYLVGGVGSHNRFRYMLDWWMHHDADPQKWIEDDHAYGGMIVVDADKRVWFFDDYPLSFEVLEVPAGWGSGSSYALGALKAGVDIHNAIRIATELDSGTGGEVEVLRL